MNKASEYFLLEHVPKVWPMDVLFIELGHLLMIKRTEFGVQDPGTILLEFNNGSLRLFMEKEKWLAAGKKILAYTLQSDDNVSHWNKRIESWTKHMAELAHEYKKTDFSVYKNDSLSLALDTMLDVERTN